MGILAAVVVMSGLGGVVALAFKAFGIDSKKINSYFEN